MAQLLRLSALFTASLVRAVFLGTHDADAVVPFAWDRTDDLDSDYLADDANPTELQVFAEGVVTHDTAAVRAKLQKRIRRLRVALAQVQAQAVQPRMTLPVELHFVPNALAPRKEEFRWAVLAALCGPHVPCPLGLTIENIHVPGDSSAVQFANTGSITHGDRSARVDITVLERDRDADKNTFREALEKRLRELSAGDPALPGLAAARMGLISPTDTEQTHATLSTTTQIVLCFVGPFLCAKVALIAVQTVRGARGQRRSKIFIALERANALADWAPMLCAVCLLARDRAMQLHTDRSSPPRWIQALMHVVLVGWVLIIVLAPFATSVTGKLTKNEQVGASQKNQRMIVSLMQVLAVTTVLGGAAAIGTGTVLMRPESVVLEDGTTGESWNGEGDPPKLERGIALFWILAFMFFGVTLLHQLLKYILKNEAESKGQDIIEQRGLWRSSNRRVIVRVHLAALLARNVVLTSPLIAIFYVVAVMIRTHYGSKDDRKLTDTEEHVRWFLAAAAGCVVLEVMLAFYAGMTDRARGLGARDVLEYTNGSFADSDADSESDSEYMADGAAEDYLSRVKLLAPTMYALQAAAAVAAAIMMFVAASQLRSLLVGHLVKTSHSAVTFFECGPGAFVLASVALHTIWRVVSLRQPDTRGALLLVSIALLAQMLAVLFVAIRMHMLEIGGAGAIVPNDLNSKIAWCGYTYALIVFAFSLLIPLMPENEQTKPGVLPHAAYRESKLQNTIRGGLVFSGLALLIVLCGFIVSVVAWLLQMSPEDVAPTSIDVF